MGEDKAKTKAPRQGHYAASADTDTVRFNAITSREAYEWLTRLKRDQRVSYGQIVMALIDELNGKNTFLTEQPSIAMDDVPFLLPNQQQELIVA